MHAPQHHNVPPSGQKNHNVPPQRFVNIDTSFTQKRSVMEKVILISTLLTLFFKQRRHVPSLV